MRFNDWFWEGLLPEGSGHPRVGHYYLFLAFMAGIIVLFALGVFAVFALVAWFRAL